MREYEERVRETEQRQKEVLSLIGLEPSDFCRFRDAYEEDGQIVVETRENGIGGRSIKAIQKAGDKLVETFADECDSTYQYYVFRRD